MANKDLNKAKAAKKDEFYTRLEDIENELRHYRQHFKGKTVLCNCDDPRCSNFFRYFTLSFEVLGLKKVIATCYKNQDVDLFSQHACERAVYQIYEGDKNNNRKVDDEEIEVRYLEGDGDFRSKECVELLKEADIVVYADKDCLRPHILVECKRQEVSEAEYQQAIEQAYSYAFALPSDIKYVWVTSGIKSDYFEVDKSQNTRSRVYRKLQICLWG